MLTSYELTREFHAAMGMPIAEQPAAISPERIALRLALLAEEVAELVAALTGQDEQAYLLRGKLSSIFAAWLARAGEPDLAQVAKELVDVHVVVSGTAVELGIPEDQVAELVHASNLAKAAGPKRPDGKQLKPVGWQAPDVHALLFPTARGV